jgi:hypothetical protein
VDVLNVILTSEEERVSVYNSLGAKIDEAIVTGGKHVFDVSSYAPGLYFVKTSDSVARFIK